jgi:hypothetical protein
LPLGVHDAGDVAGRAVGIVLVAEHHLAFALDAVQRLFVGEEVALAVADGHHRRALLAEAGGEAGLAVDHVQRHRLADVLQLGVAQQGAGQQARLAQHLEAVADPDHRHALGGLDHFAHHRALGRHGPAAQVVAVREAAGQDDQVQVVRQGRLLVPDHFNAGSGGALDGDLAVTIAIGTGEDDDGGFHGAGL